MDSIFQLTASRRGWPDPGRRTLAGICISTHSLTKRLTLFISYIHHCSRYFNSQPHEEADDNLITLITAGFTFQLTASRRGWRYYSGTVIHADGISTHSLTKRLTVLSMENVFYCNHFNSQPHEEADVNVKLKMQDMLLFQLTASRRGWLEVMMIGMMVRNISTHSLTKRLTSKPAWPSP